MQPDAAFATCGDRPTHASSCGQTLLPLNDAAGQCSTSSGPHLLSEADNLFLSDLDPLNPPRYELRLRCPGCDGDPGPWAAAGHPRCRQGERLFSHCMAPARVCCLAPRVHPTKASTTSSIHARHQPHPKHVHRMQWAFRSLSRRQTPGMPPR